MLVTKKDGSTRLCVDSSRFKIQDVFISGSMAHKIYRLNESIKHTYTYIYIHIQFCSMSSTALIASLL